MSMIGVQRRLTELGRIRLGDKGTKGQPQKLSKFRLTSASRPLLEAAARVYGGTVRAWQGAPDDGYWELYTETDALDIMVPPVMNAYSQLYEIWDAGGCTVRCDGAWDSIGDVACDHDHTPDALAPDGKEWRVTTRVSVILPKLPGLGTWRLDTKGWNAAATLPPALDMLLATGQRGWVPAILRLEQQSSKKKVPGPNGQLRSQTFRYVVPIIDILGITFAELLASGTTDASQIGVGDQTAIPAHTLTPGPHRPPSGTKVDRPALGPAPALPERSDFRKPETPPITPVPPSTNGHSAPAEPETVAGWVLEGDAAPVEVLEATAAPDDDALPFGEPAEAEVVVVTPDDLATRIRAAATSSGLVGAMQAPQAQALGALLKPIGSRAAKAGIEALWPGIDWTKPSAAQANAIVMAADSDAEFATHWAALVEQEAATSAA